MYGKLVAVYEGERSLGGAELQLQDGCLGLFKEEIREIRVSHYSPPSERCPPLAVIHTVNSARICFKLESAAKNVESSLSVMHATCLRQNKTAIASVGGEEFHLVAMHSRKFGQTPCFWAFNVASALYDSCLVMLNLRCLGIVFDLDETLIVANTLRSFEDRIDSVQRKVSTETDPQRVASMLAEVKRYQDDKNILKQYAESDQVIDYGKVIRSESEVVLAVSDNQQTIVRPLIRLQDRNIILTRINPLIRDTSVLVRLRPAWEDLKSYLIAKGRKRFEVFVCTMAERDYALEMWRLLDPGSNLINPRELSDRIVCVKSGFRKSLFNVFQDGNCHPKMALVIDDRLKVWDEQDQPRVHVVPAFSPYFAPQAEANNTIPVLCVARNVACNVRGVFFKEFDEGLMQSISGVAYEDDIKDLPSAPDVGNYLVSEDDSLASNGNKDTVAFDGMADAEVERRLKEAMSACSTAPSPMMNIDSRTASPFQFAIPSTSFPVHQPNIQGPTVPFPGQQLPQVATMLRAPPDGPAKAEKTLRSSPVREEGEVPESELDPDTRRRLLILQHGQDMREPPKNETKFPARPPGQVPLPRGVDGQVPLPRGHPHGWFPVEEEMNMRRLNRVSPPLEFHPEPLPVDKNRPRNSNFLHDVQPSIPPSRIVESHKLPKEEHPRQDQLRLNEPLSDFHSISEMDLDSEAGQIDPSTTTSTGALQEIAFKSGTKVEFKQTLVPSTELQFSVEVLFAGEKIGEGIGRTRREAQHQAAEGSLFNLADKYLSQLRPDPSNMSGDGSNLGQFSYKSQGSPRSMQEMPSKRLKPEPSRVLQRMPSSARPPKNAPP